jgi:hypothetical protein
MIFNDEQKAALSAKLDRSHVKSRDQAGRSLSYVEGWHVINEANRILALMDGNAARLKCAKCARRTCHHHTAQWRCLRAMARRLHGPRAHHRTHPRKDRGRQARDVACCA